MHYSERQMQQFIQKIDVFVLMVFAYAVNKINEK